MRVVNAEVKEKMKAYEVEAERYTNLPKASDRAEGMIKYDNNTLKLNNIGQLYVAKEGSGSGDESLATEHIADETKHLNNLRRKNLDETMPKHMDNSSIHVTKIEKDELLASLDLLETHLLKFHLSKEDYDATSKLISDTKTAIDNHIKNGNLHPSSTTVSDISKTLSELTKKVNDLVSDYGIFKPSTEREIDSLESSKFNKGSHPINKILCTNSDGEVYYMNASILDLEAIENFHDTITKIREDIGSLDDRKAEKTALKSVQDAANNHYKDTTVHTTTDEKNKFLDRLNALEEFNELNPPGGGIELTKSPTAGNVAFYNNENAKIATPAFIMYKGSFVDNTAELEEAKKATVNFEDVFNKWKRFSHDRTNNQPANPSETTAWRYDAATKKVICTVNSDTHIGFVSNEKYDTYTHECTIKSSDGDNDMIGVVIAFAVDSTGKEHTLTLVRNASTEGHVQVPGATSFQWGIVYNFGRADAKLISSKAIEGDKNISWSAITNGIRIKVERKGNSIKAYTSKMDETVLLDSSLIEANLYDPLLNKFAGEKSYGYSCLSQNSSTFEDIKFIGGTLDGIYDMSTGDKWVEINGSWVKDTLTPIQESLGFGKLLYNELTKKLFFLKDAENITRINLISPQSKAMEYNKKHGTSSERPISPNVYDEPYFDTDLNKALWWNGTNWIDAMGNIV